MSDLISRQAAIDIELDGTESNIEILSVLRSQFNCFDEMEEPVYRALSDAISALRGWWSYPLPAQPERKTGEWLHKDLDNFRKYEVICSVCGARFIGNYDAYDEPYDFNFCPNCGADMRDPLAGHMNPPEDEA